MRRDRWCTFSWSICDKNYHITRCIESDNTSHGKTTSAKRKSGRNSTLTERDRRKMGRIVSKNDTNTAAQVTAELSIHLEDPVSTGSTSN
jgi:hypothetical protein